jgi:hypothetical protein
MTPLQKQMVGDEQKKYTRTDAFCASKGPSSAAVVRFARTKGFFGSCSSSSNARNAGVPGFALQINIYIYVHVYNIYIHTEHGLLEAAAFNGKALTKLSPELTIISNFSYENIWNSKIRRTWALGDSSLQRQGAHEAESLLALLLALLSEIRRTWALGDSGLQRQGAHEAESWGNRLSRAAQMLPASQLRRRALGRCH